MDTDPSPHRAAARAAVRISVEDPVSAAVQRCWQAYFDELDARFESGFDPATSAAVAIGDLVEPAGVVLIAWLDGEPIGTGAVKFGAADWAELKRMWVAPAARGLGVGGRLLDELERRAATAGARAVRLETNGVLTEAIKLYRSRGYVEWVDRAAFNDDPYAQYWFEKRLTGVESDHVLDG